ncbi:hypothetical protein QTP88_018411 [Uroleucon formosanum]
MVANVMHAIAFLLKKFLGRLFSLQTLGGTRERDPRYQKLRVRGIRIRNTRRGQPARCAMGKSRPGGTASLITASARPLRKCTVHRPLQRSYPKASGPATASQNAFPALGHGVQDAGHTPYYFPGAGTPATVRQPPSFQNDRFCRRHLPTVFCELRIADRRPQVSLLVSAKSLRTF